MLYIIPIKSSAIIYLSILYCWHYLVSAHDIHAIINVADLNISVPYPLLPKYTPFLSSFNQNCSCWVCDMCIFNDRPSILYSPVFPKHLKSHSLQHNMRVPFIPELCQYLVFSNFNHSYWSCIFLTTEIRHPFIWFSGHLGLLFPVVLNQVLGSFFFSIEMSLSYWHVKVIIYSRGDSFVFLTLCDFFLLLLFLLLLFCFVSCFSMLFLMYRRS